MKEMSDLIMILTTLSFLRNKEPYEIIQNCTAKDNTYNLGSRCLAQIKFKPDFIVNTVSKLDRTQSEIEKIPSG